MNKRKQQIPSNTQPSSLKKKKKTISPKNSSLSCSPLRQSDLNNCSIVKESNDIGIADSTFVNQEVQTLSVDTFNNCIQELTHMQLQDKSTEYLISIDRKLSCLIGLFTELKSKLSLFNVTNSSAEAPNQINNINQSSPAPGLISPVTISYEDQKEKLYNLSKNRNNIALKLCRNNSIADRYETNLNCEDPLVPKKLCEHIGKFDKEYLIEFKKRQSILNTKNEIEKLRLIAKDQQVTITNIDHSAEEYFHDNQSLRSFWQSNIDQNKVKVENEIKGKLSFFSSSKHVIPISFLDITTKRSTPNNFSNKSSYSSSHFDNNGNNPTIQPKIYKMSSYHTPTNINNKIQHRHFNQETTYCNQIPQSRNNYSFNKSTARFNNNNNAMNYSFNNNNSPKNDTPISLFPSSFLEKGYNFRHRMKQ